MVSRQRSCRQTIRQTRAVGRGEFLLLVAATLLLSSVVAAQQGGGNQIASLKGVAVPQPADLARYVSNPQVLVALGKALFWDVQVGSDGLTACATCHFHAGADHRITNQLAGPQTSTTPVQVNVTLASADFPFHAFENQNSNATAPIAAAATSSDRPAW